MMEEFKDADNGASVTMKEIVNPPSDLNTSFEKCKLVTPYLALKEFLGDLNPSSNYCDVPLSVNESVVTTTSESINKPIRESIFRNIAKRLTLMKTNVMSPLLYVEGQGKLLSDAFYNLEKRQVKKSENLMSQLNETTYTQVPYLENEVEKIKTEFRNLFRAQSHQSSTSINGWRMEAQSVARSWLIQFIFETRFSKFGANRQSNCLKASRMERLPLVKTFTKKHLPKNVSQFVDPRGL
ncbi:hypothetical protein OXX80_007714 [Metschnikowia pulcherrima]